MISRASIVLIGLLAIGSYFISSMLFTPVLIVVVLLHVVPRGSYSSNSTMIVMGSGGHTTEMLSYLSTFTDNLEYHKFFGKRIYLVAETDNHSEGKVIVFEKLKKGKANFDDYEILKIKRSREVGQSYSSSVITTLKAIFNCFFIVLRERPRLLIMNGPGTCLPVCICAWLLKVIGVCNKVKIVLMETYACIHHPSLTTKLLRPFVDLLCVQWPDIHNMFPESVFIGRLEEYNENIQSNENVVNNKVLVTVGSTKHEQLIEAVDNEDFINQLIDFGFKEISIQKGNGEYVPSNIQHLKIKVNIFEYTPSLQLEIMYSDLIITHAGTGTIFECLGMRKRVIAVPNTTLMNNHQVEIAEFMDQHDYLVHSDHQSLTSNLERAVNFYPKYFPPHETEQFKKCIEMLDRNFTARQIKQTD